MTQAKRMRWTKASHAAMRRKDRAKIKAKMEAAIPAPRVVAECWTCWPKGAHAVFKERPTLAGSVPAQHRAAGHDVRSVARKESR